jgi:threonine aldolase
MGNLVSHMAHVPRGGQIVAAAESHLVMDEAGGHAVISGASVRPVAARPDGTFDPDEVSDAIRDDADPHESPTSLVVLENTHAQTGGQPLSAEHTAEIARRAHARDIPVHVDGARLFNAAVALGTPARELLAHVDSATFCLSKGLACPVGSVVVGGRDFIWRARRARKMVGGGMRQVGILAAAGLVALRDGPAGMIERLADDHVNARWLGEALAAMPGVGGLDPARVTTNFVLFRVDPADGQDSASRDRLRSAFLDRCAADGLLLVAYPHGQVRAVTHYGIERADVERAAGIIRAALSDLGVAPRMSTAAVPAGAAAGS